MEHIVLFGGSFDPPHLGHQFVIQQAFELIKDIDQLWVLPANKHTFQKDLTETKHRLAMCRLLSEGIKKSKILNTKYKIQLCPIEIDYKSKGETIETLKLLGSEIDYLIDKKLRSPNSDLRTPVYSFLMGSDQLQSFEKWSNWQQLIKIMHFYIYPRSGFSQPKLYQNMTLLESPTQIITNISSTLIKNRIHQNLPYQDLLPPSIAGYIKTQNLYL